MPRQAASLSRSSRESFDLTGRVAIITGGAGLLGQSHAEAVAEWGGTPVLLDINAEGLRIAKDRICREYGAALGIECDITVPSAVRDAQCATLAALGRVDILINNAANNPKVTAAGLDKSQGLRLETMDLAAWERDLAVGLTGAFLCCQVFGAHLAQQGRGVILNVASDLAMIAPDQRIYRVPGLSDAQQPVKPVTYSVIKAGLLGLTRYLSTYWADHGVRANTLCPGGVYDGQGAEMLSNLSKLIPLGRMARADEYKAAVAFLVSDASSYMTGASLTVDGGRTAW